MNSQPNILLILTDQHAPKIAGFAGNSIVKTQNLDSLAKGSVYFRNASCPSPSCTPSRMCLMTAKEPHRCAAWSNHWIIFPEHITWPGYFADHGYSTCLVGKMHFGGKDQFDGFQFRPYGDFHHGLSHQPDPLTMFPNYSGAESAGVTEIPESLIQDVIVTRETQAFLLEHQSQNSNQPWFVCAGYSRPHSPFTTPGRYFHRYRNNVPPIQHSLDFEDSLEPFALQKYKDHYSQLTSQETQLGREAYYACVDFVDDCIGELLLTLEGNGLLENTIVIYTSDHGEMAGRHGLWGKGLYYEESVGVPLLIKGPGIKSGHFSISDVISLIDLFPTCCGLTGLPIPERLDGIDFSGFLSNPSELKSPREFTTSQHCDWGTRIKSQALPIGQPHRAWRAIRTQKWKYVDIQGGKPLLFDLINDSQEINNLAHKDENFEVCRKLQDQLSEGFCWENVVAQLLSDRERIPSLLSGVKPSTPNQYRLPDGRLFDAEGSLYEARWLRTDDEVSGGIIPQQFG